MKQGTKILLAIYFIFLSSPLDLLAQTVNSYTAGNSTPKVSKQYLNRLFPGNQLPDSNFIFSETKNYDEAEITWNKLKSKKLVILDFWSKYCSACIEAFPKMEKLQNQFGDQIQIILITYNKKEELSYLFKNSYNVRNTKLPMVFADSTFTQRYFPHSGVPYHVWIGQDNKVIATVNSDQTTTENISAYLNGLQPNFVMRNDHVDKIQPDEVKDPKKSIFSFDNGRFLTYLLYYSKLPDQANNQLNPKLKNINEVLGSSSNKNYSAIFSNDPGYTLGVGNISVIQDENGNDKGLRIFNTELRGILRKALLGIGNEIKLLSLDSSLLQSPSFPSGHASSDYSSILQTKFSYESYLNKYSDSTAARTLLNDLYKYFGLYVVTQPRKHPCLTFTISDPIKVRKLYSDPKSEEIPTAIEKDNEIILINNPWIAFKSQLTVYNKSNNDLILIDSTGIANSQATNLKLPINTWNLTEDNIQRLKKYLLDVGIHMVYTLQDLPTNIVLYNH